MTDANWAPLRNHFLARYKIFKKRLTQYLGSADLAGEALQDTWLRLERGGELATVRSPDTYLYSMAINIARDHVRAENRRLTTSEIEVLLEIADDKPDVARSMEARTDLDMLASIIKELPLRQQAILLAARLEGLPRQQIAERFGVSVRFVQRELQEAHDYCAERFEKMTNDRFRQGASGASTHQRPFGTGSEKVDEIEDLRGMIERNDSEADLLKQDARRWVTRLVSGEATTADAESLKRWRQQSSAHEAAYAEAIRFWKDLGSGGAGLHCETRRACVVCTA